MRCADPEIVSLLREGPLTRHELASDALPSSSIENCVLPPVSSTPLSSSSYYIAASTGLMPQPNNLPTRRPTIDSPGARRVQT